MAGGGRRGRILDRLVGDGAPPLETNRLCQVCAEVVEVTGAGIMLMSDDVAQGSICSTDPRSALIEELQFSLGEGPCVDAYHQNRPVLEPNLAGPGPSRWLAFTAAAVESGVCAVFGFPLQLGAIRLGALNLYRDRPGPLTDDQHADAVVMAEVSAQTVLSMQGDAPGGGLADALEANASLRAVVHQASGMVAAQLGVSVAQALIRLQAFAFGNGRDLSQVADEVVARTLRFDEPRGDPDHGP